MFDAPRMELRHYYSRVRPLGKEGKRKKGGRGIDETLGRYAAFLAGEGEVEAEKVRRVVHWGPSLPSAVSGGGIRGAAVEKARCATRGRWGAAPAAGAACAARAGRPPLRPGLQRTRSGLARRLA